MFLTPFFVLLERNIGMSKYRKQQKEKEIIIKRICEAAQIYKERLVGKK